MAHDKFVVMVKGVVKEYTSDQYTASFGHLPTHESAGEGRIFGGRYSAASHVVSGSGVVDANGYYQGDLTANTGSWDSSLFVSESAKL